MVAFAYVLSYPLIKAKKEEATKAVMFFIGLVSIVYGAVLLL
jgi:hypothetical protein